MKEIGEKLLKARELKGISLEQISELTKIRLVYLQALETGEFDNLPDKVYVRGFLKSYAQIIDLDPREILEIYQNYIDQFPVKAVAKLENTLIYKRPRSVGKIIVTILIIGVVGGVGFFAQNILSTIKNETIPQLLDTDPERPLNLPDSSLNNDQLSINIDLIAAPQDILERLYTEPADQKNSLDTDSEKVASPRGAEEPPEEIEIEKTLIPLNPQLSDRDDQPSDQLADSAETEKDRVEQPIEEEKTIEIPTLLAKEDQQSQTEESREKTSLEEQKAVQLQIIAKDDAWIRVSIDDHIRFQGIIDKDNTEIFAGKKIIVRTTNAAAIQINFGGVLLGPFGEAGEFMEKVFGE